MSCAEKFNDPYDCAINPSISELSLKEVELIKNSILLNQQISDNIKTLSSTLDDNVFSKQLINNITEIINTERENFLKKRGVCCFSGTNNNLLMWAHYASSFTGYCLEFNTKFEPFSNVEKVYYSPNIPCINIVDFLVKPNEKIINQLYLSKADCWKYENEWRLINMQAESNIEYSIKSLKSVYFGPKMDYATKEMIWLILNGQNRDVKYYEGFLSDKKYEIYFEEFYYMPYIEAMSENLQE